MLKDQTCHQHLEVSVRRACMELVCSRRRKSTSSSVNMFVSRHRLESETKLTPVRTQSRRPTRIEASSKIIPAEQHSLVIMQKASTDRLEEARTKMKREDDNLTIVSPSLCSASHDSRLNHAAYQRRPPHQDSSSSSIASVSFLAIALLHLTIASLSHCQALGDASNHRSANVTDGTLSGILDIGRHLEVGRDTNTHNTGNYNQLKSGSRNLVLVHHHQSEQPDFVEPIGNHTVAVGRDAQLVCKISNLGNYRTAWLRVEDKGILTIHNNVITRNYRFGLLPTEDEQSFVLTIKNVQPSDKGGYMCQINSVPMKYAVGYLDVLTPPVFEDATTTSAVTSSADSSPSDLANDQQQPDKQQQLAANSSQVSVVEGSGATLTCLAQGHPKPTITWRREDGRPILLNGFESSGADLADLPTEIKDTSSLTFSSVNRLNSGAYLCIASNGVQPSASKRQLLDVKYSPTITVPQTEIAGWANEHEAQLECLVDSNPAGSYHWVKLATSTTNTDRRPVMANQEDDLWLIEHDELMPSDKFDIVIKQINSEKVRMVLVIRQVDKQDFSWYKCIAKNSLGLQSNFVRFYESPSGHLAATTTTASSSFSFKNIIRLNDFVGGGGGGASRTDNSQQQDDNNKLNLPQNDDSRLSFQRSSSSSVRSSAQASISLLSNNLVPARKNQLSILYNCQFATLVSLVVIASLLNLSTMARQRFALFDSIQT